MVGEEKGPGHSGEPVGVHVRVHRSGAGLKRLDHALRPGRGHGEGAGHDVDDGILVVADAGQGSGHGVRRLCLSQAAAAGRQRPLLPGHRLPLLLHRPRRSLPHHRPPGPPPPPPPTSCCCPTAPSASWPSPASTSSPAPSLSSPPPPSWASAAPASSPRPGRRPPPPAPP